MLKEITGTRTGQSKVECNKAWGPLTGLWERLHLLIQGLFTLWTKTPVWQHRQYWWD